MPPKRALNADLKSGATFAVAWWFARTLSGALRGLVRIRCFWTRCCRGVSLVVNYDRGLIRKHREEYMSLTPMEGARTAVSWVRGRGRSLMHHKFAVYLDASKRPLSVTTGSFNWTKQSTKNLEHVVEVCDPEVAARFMQEHLDVLTISTPLPKPRKPRTRGRRKPRDATANCLFEIILVFFPQGFDSAVVATSSLQLYKFPDLFDFV